MSDVFKHYYRWPSKNNTDLRIKSENLKYIFSYRNKRQKDSNKNIYKYIKNKRKNKNHYLIKI